MADEKKSDTGGCLCGAVRYEGDDFKGPIYCHCSMCRKAAGGTFALVSQCDNAEFRITKGEPKWFASSEVMERGFCELCGTPLFIRFQAPEWSTFIMASVGSLDHPEQLKPERHFGVETQLPWLEFHDGLPREPYPERYLEDFAERLEANPDAPVFGEDGIPG